MPRPYDTASWRALPRDRCAVADLLGDECAGDIALHHVRPLSLGGDERVIPVCARHHPSLEALARRVHGLPEIRRCPHQHRTVEARLACERRLNREMIAA